MPNHFDPPDHSEEVYFFQTNMNDDAESAYLAVKKVIQSDNLVNEITKVWAWAYSQDDDDAIIMANKMGLGIRNAYAVLDWKDQYKYELDEYNSNRYVGDGYD